MGLDRFRSNLAQIVCNETGHNLVVEQWHQLQQCS